jgi:RecA-family ATPase
MAASLASGKPFLGHHKFQVPQAVPVGVYSGESGRATIQDTRRRVYEAKSISGAQIFWCFEVPQFDSQADIAAIVKNITDNRLAVVIFDPLYLSMCGIGDGASNMFKVGALLRPIAEACIKAGATPIFVHHNTKGNSKNYEPPELEDMAWAGFAEFARQWLLIGRRELYEIGSGVHKLWMNIGSSAGFNGCYGVDVEEGTANAELRGRKWDVSVRPQRDIITQKMQLRGEKNAQKACETQERLDRALTHFGCAGATMTEIEAYAHMNKKKALDLLEHMVERGQVEKCQVRKRNGTFEGYRWVREICPG